MRELATETKRLNAGRRSHVLGLALITAAFLATVCASGQALAATARVSGSKGSDTAATAKSYASAFGVFRSDRSANTRARVVPTDDAGLIHLMMSEPIMQGATTTSQSVVNISNGPQVLVLASANGICVGAQLPDGSSGVLAGMLGGQVDCTTLANAEQGGVGNVSYNADGTATLFGIVPNGNQHVTLNTDSGSQTVPVSGNVFYAPELPGYTGRDVVGADGVLRQFGLG